MKKQIRNEGMQIDAFKLKQDFDKEVYKKALNRANQKLKSNLALWGDKFPDSSTINNKYSLNIHGANPGSPISEEPGRNIGWTTGFWTGILFLLYENLGDDSYLNYLDNQIRTFIERAETKEDCKTHDIGFLYSLSCIADYKLRGNEESKEAALLAADILMERYVERANILQAWGDMNDPNQRGRMIIDCLMNLPLLYWASQVTGNQTYHDAAYKHAKNAANYIVREDGTTYHTFFFDTENGSPRFGKTFQGYSDDSCWARGEAWGIYGFTLSYLYTKDPDFLDLAKTLANYFLNRSPKDLVAYWDLIFNEENNEEKDSSATAIAVCGLFELTKHLTDEEEKRYFTNAGHLLLQALYENYSTKPEDNNDGLILHGVYSKPGNFGVDESNLWGDYFYLEALIRATTSWNLYW